MCSQFLHHIFGIAIEFLLDMFVFVLELGNLGLEAIDVPVSFLEEVGLVFLFQLVEVDLVLECFDLGVDVVLVLVDS